ncbi:hypothetical protein HMPREF3192_01387 [Atopobium deltae]|uniref:Uncharacterized protein n=1 Tax=Atopobium deltae TaxID=1393034 RepID=A0A133XQ07_9ACTN|nr:hypothetical protein HMPREF3192_01387 [Atopobium deltae]
MISSYKNLLDCGPQIKKSRRPALCGTSVSYTFVTQLGQRTSCNF